ncbi:Hypothetical predicted protein [Lecanosticta acicola]|uniref:Uncharacterized protein n=1 Tax=Lecanosticta acicola TaxID=111012 RepID=A0AAI8YUP4_9PEZI|nr:Hypothetical predicted protein [Lecanosticta acicola]
MADTTQNQTVAAQTNTNSEGTNAYRNNKSKKQGEGSDKAETETSAFAKKEIERLQKEVDAYAAQLKAERNCRRVR